jgi:hypothetical protein
MVSTAILRVDVRFQDHETYVRVRYLVKGFQKLAVRVPNEHDLHPRCVIIDNGNPVLTLDYFDLWAQPHGWVDKQLVPRYAVCAGRIPLKSHYEFTES